MTTTKRNTITLAALAILALTAGLALAQGPGAGRFGQGQGRFCDQDGPGQRWERMAEVLDLTDEQQTQIEELRAANRAKNQDLHKEMARLRNELEGELLADDVDTAAALKLQQRLGDLRTQVQKNRLATRLAVREVLTPEQRDRMLAAKSGFGKRGGRHGHGGPRAGRDHRGHRGCRFDID